MRIAYITTGMQWPFVTVINEMETLEQMGWSILPLASWKQHVKESTPDLIRRWNQRGIFRPSVLTQFTSVFREMLTHPIPFFKMLFWMFYLASCSLTEFAKAMYEFPAACYFAGHCRKFDAQHIHVHFASRSLTLGLMLGMLVGTPVSCTVHAFDIFTRKPSSLKPRLIKCCLIAAISEFHIEYLRKTCGEKIANLCHVVHCGIDIPNITIEKRCLQPGLLISVSRLQRKKGLDIAVKACAKLKREGVDYKFLMIGAGPEQKRLEQLIQSLDLQENVELVGQVSNDGLTSLFSKANAFVLPCVKDRNGDMDGVPMAMMEAMICRVPVISTLISGIPELVKHNVNGLLVNEKDSDALAEAIKELVNNPEKTIKFGEAGHQYVQEHFDINKTSAQLRGLIEEVNQD